MARTFLNYTAAQLAAIKSDALVTVRRAGTSLEIALSDLVQFFSPKRVVVSSLVNFTATAGSQARDTVNFTVPAGEFAIGDLIHYRFTGKVTAASSTSACTLTGELNAAGTPTTAVGITSPSVTADTSGVAVEFEGYIKWTSATAWATMTAAGTAATPGSKVIASAHLIDLCLTVSGATNVTVAGVFEAALIRP